MQILKILAVAVWLALAPLRLTAQQPAPKPDAPAAQSDEKKADAQKDEKKEEKKDEKKDEKKPADKPFADIVKDAQVTKGLFTFHRTEEKVFLELLPDQLEKTYILTLTCESGLGERGFYAAMMCGAAPIAFHKQGKTIQLRLKNPRFTAAAGTPMSRAVARSFSESILGIAKIESQPHPDRKSLLIDLGTIFIADVPMMAYDLEATFRIPYRFDAKASDFGTLKAFEKNVEIETIAHYATERPPVPPITPPGGTPPPRVAPPRNLPDVRSALFRFRYSLAELPQTGYSARLADDRVGHFFDRIEDFTDDVAHVPTRRFINRWHLEKADPSAAKSKPKQAIVFWLENTIPLKYRDAIRDGVLMWNAAFERIGFENAIEVRQQPDDADWDPADVRYNTVRWFNTTDAVFAIGPSNSNPFSGQLFNADIGFSEGMTRMIRREHTEMINPATALDQDAPRPFIAPWSSVRGRMLCGLAESAVRDASFSLEVLAARGADSEGTNTDQFIRTWLRMIAAHEVGHTLGLRHNFRASTIHPFERLGDRSVTMRDGLTGSVMDYIPTNVAVRGAPQGEFHQSTLGTYDFWAIEYAYKPIPATSPEAELPELKRIAARSSDPKLAYGTDEDAGGFFAAPWEMDPLANRGDLGANPMRFVTHRVDLANEIFANMETKLEKQGEGYQVLRRAFNIAVGERFYVLGLAAKYVGGIYHHRDHVGDPGNRLPFQPVPAAEQREALELLRKHLFAPEAFAFSPRLLNKLANERFPDWSNFEQQFGSRGDVPIHALIANAQRRALDRLYHPVVLSRILDSEVKAEQPASAFRLDELFTVVQNAVWAELKQPQPGINSYRRSLQREHLRRMTALILSGSQAPEDARSLARESLVSLERDLQNAVAGAQGTTRAHLAESLARVEEALKAVAHRS
jgi:hypothetical protein